MSKKRMTPEEIIELIQAPEVDAVKEAGLKRAVASVLEKAATSFGNAGVCRASMNPDIAALAEHYEVIGETWQRYAMLLMESNPATGGSR